MDTFLLVGMLAVIVEGLVEYGKSIWKLATEKDKKALILQLAALAISIFLCLLTGADFFSGLGVVFAWPLVGSVFTGVFISRGSNYVSDFIGRLRGAGKSSETLNTTIYK